MLSYNTKSLDHRLINSEAADAFHQHLISNEDYAAIENAHPVALYEPNLFIRIGLFIVTVIIVCMCFGLSLLMVGSSFYSNKPYGTICVVFSLLVYAALEFLIHEKRHFRSGVDDALLWLSMGFMTAAVYLLFLDISNVAQAVIFFILSLYATIRFANPVMSGIMFFSFLAIIFYGIVPLGAVAKSILPFVVMLLSLLTYWLVKKNKNRTVLRHYVACRLMLEVLSLSALYASVNYLVVRELSNELFNLHLKDGASIPGGWLFWAATLLIPVGYIFRALQTKDALLLRTGLVVMAAAIFTIRYYYSFAPIEIIMTAGGLVMIMLMYLITKYFRIPKFGITTKDPNDPDVQGLLQVEGLIVSETFQQSSLPGTSENFQFGGGSSGGGGVSGEY